MAASLFTLIFRLLSRLPLSLLQRLGGLLGYLIYYASPSYARRMRENLAQAGLADQLSATIAEAGKALTELPWVWLRPYPEVLSKVKQFIGREHIEAALADNKGIILLTPHLGCFEMCALTIAEQTPLTVLYRQPKLAWIEQVMCQGRQRGLVKLAKADISGVRLLYKSLKRAEAIGLLPDQVPGKGDGVWADFFGKPAYTMTLVSRLVENTGAHVLMTYTERLPKGEGYIVRVDRLQFDATQGAEQQINHALEQLIRRHPTQYLWSYNRYKAPKGSLPADRES